MRGSKLNKDSILVEESCKILVRKDVQHLTQAASVLLFIVLFLCSCCWMEVGLQPWCGIIKYDQLERARLHGDNPWNGGL